MTCLTCAANNCPAELLAFAIIGGIVVYALFAYLFMMFGVSLFNKRRLDELDENDKTLVVICSLFFPISIPVLIAIGIVYLIARVIYNILFCATREDLRQLETKITTKIDMRCNPVTPVQNTPKLPFKVGDLVVGVKGNPDKYKHLNEGSVSKVLSIDSKGKMKLVMIDHKDWNNQKDSIGKIFTAPARNFTLKKKK